MNRALVAACAVSILSLAFASTASARAQRVGQVPNGPSFSCGLCHLSPSGGARNAFGQQAEGALDQPGAAGAVVWADLYSLDADGDGATNGAELGDPDGIWQPGDPAPDEFSDPNDAASTPGEPDVNNGENNGGNNGDNNGAGNNGGGDDEGGGGGGGGGCATAPGHGGAAGVLALLVGACFFLRRRS